MVQLHRKWKFDNETIGELSIEGKFFCYTLELPWRDNQRQISCIPEGEYDCIWQRSPRFGLTYQILNVPDRSRILIHSGNLSRHTYGCVLLGRKRGWLEYQQAVLISKPTVSKFSRTMSKENFKMEVI